MHGTSLGRNEGAVVAPSGFAPGPQWAPQGWTRRACGEEGGRREAVKAFVEVGVQDLCGFWAHGRAKRCQRIVAGTPGAQAVALGGEARLPCGFQGAVDEGVAGSIGHGWEAEGSWLRRAWWRAPDAADRGRGAVAGQGLCQGEVLGGGQDLPPSTPAVRWPRWSWVTWRTARSLADQECSRRRWRLRTVRTS